LATAVITEMSQFGGSLHLAALLYLFCRIEDCDEMATLVTIAIYNLGCISFM